MRSVNWRACRGRIGAPRGVDRFDSLRLGVTGQRRAELPREGDHGRDVLGTEDVPQVGPRTGGVVNQSHEVHHQKKQNTAAMMTVVKNGRSFSTGRGF
jgi:hypothetical protein